MMAMTRSLLPMLGCLLIASCTTNPDGTQSVNRTAVVAAVGAVAGGVLGNRIDDGNRGRGTAIGAVSGAAVGAGVGYMMDRQERELREQLAAERAANEVQIERVRDDLLKLTLENEVSFDFDSAAVKPAFRPTIDKLASVLTKYDRNMVTVVGHTDSTGAESYNESLSLRRAETVMQELSVRGVPRSRMSALRRGESEPRAGNESEAGRQLNRRVEILVRPLA
jgi:outer membrane protein OmpA-like peptidoglycan-associated protein